MTHQNQSNVLEQVLELLRDNGDEGYAQVLELILNQAMLIERSQALGANPTSAPQIAVATPTASNPRPLTAAWAS